MLYKILIYLFLFQNGNNFVYIIFSRCRKKVKHQEVTIRTRQKPKEETRKTRVTSCPCSHQEEENKTIIKKTDGRSASWKSVWIINCMFMPWKTTVKVLETWQLQNWGIIVTRHDAAYSYTRTGEVMNISFITTQITHLKTTSRMVHLQCTLKVPIISLPHTSSSLNSLNLSPSISTVTHFCLKVFPQKVISPATTPSEEYK